MLIEDLNISYGATRMLNLMGITKVDELLKISEKDFQTWQNQRTRYRFYFDEIFAALKSRGLSYTFERDYYIKLGGRKSNLENITINELLLTPEVRNYLDKYTDLKAFFKDITNDNVFKEENSKKKLKRFLVTNIKANQNYDWLINLFQHLGNEGALLSLLIKQFIIFVNQKTIDANSLISSFIDDNRTVMALNKQDIYFLGDLVKYDEDTLLYMDGIGKKCLEIIEESLKLHGYQLGKKAKNYYDFSFDFNKIDIKFLGLRSDLEHELRKVGVNTLNDLIVIEYTKYFSDYDNKIISDACYNLGFDWNKEAFDTTIHGTYAKANEWLQELKGIREMYSVRLANLEKNSSFLARYFSPTIPTLDKQNYRELVSTNMDLNKVTIENLKIPKRIQEYLSSYKTLAFFFYEIANDRTYEKDRNKKQLKKFLLENIEDNEDYQTLINTLNSLGNDGVLLSLIILKYQSFLQEKEVNLNMPISKIITDKRIVTVLLSLNIYFIGDLVKYSSDKLENMEGIGTNYLKKIEEDLHQYGYKLGMDTNDYFDFEFKMAAFDISVLGLDKGIETKLRKIGINNLSELITSKDTKFWLDSQNNIILQAYRNLGFFPMQGFNNPVVDNGYSETNTCLIELNLLIARYNELLIRTYKYRLGLQNIGDAVDTKSNDSFGRH